MQKEYARRENRVEQNEGVINGLAVKEKISLHSLKDTLYQENKFDAQLKYDINGCPKAREFSERDHKVLFQSNYSKGN